MAQAVGREVASLAECLFNHLAKGTDSKGHRAFELRFRSTSGYGRYVKPYGEPAAGPRRGVTPISVDVSEFLKKGGGSVKCMIGDLGVISDGG